MHFRLLLHGSLRLALLPALLALLPARAAAEDADRILLNAEVLDTTRPEVRVLRRPLWSFTGRRLHLVQFAGPIQQAWLDALARPGTMRFPPPTRTATAGPT